MGKGEYESIICVDLRSFDRTAEDMGVNAYFKQLGFVPTGLCFLNFHVMYLFDFENVDDRDLYLSIPGCMVFRSALCI